MSTGYSIQGLSEADYLSANVSETLTIGNTGLASTVRIYDCNAPLNGYLLSTSNGVFTINDANPSLPTRVGIGSTNPLPIATLQVAGTLLTSNIGTYNTNNTLYFNNTNISGINSINATGTYHTIGSGISTLTLGNATGSVYLILSDVNNAQWKLETPGYNLNFYNDFPNSGVFSTSLFYINQNGAVGTPDNVFDNGSGNSTVLGTLGVTGISTFTGATAANGGTTTTTLTASGNSTISGTLNAQNIISGSNSSTLTLTANTLSVNMANESYNTYTCSAGANIQTLNISNAIVGAQAVIFVTASTSLTIYGNSASTNVLTGTPSLIIASSPISMVSGDKAIITITYDGTSRYVSATLYK